MGWDEEDKNENEVSRSALERSRILLKTTDKGWLRQKF